MFSKILTAFFCLLTLFYVPLFAQTHSSVSLENRVYYILEQAEIRGLCSPLPGTRPYTRSVVHEKINEILDSDGTGRLSGTEREILNQYLEKFSTPKTGIDWRRGTWHGETAAGKNDTPLSATLGLIADIEGSAGIYSSDERHFGADIWLGLYMNGDLGRNVSYDFTFEGGLIRAPRRELGGYWTYYENFQPKDKDYSGIGSDRPADPDDEYVNRLIDVYSEPLTHFPYTYKKRWDSSVFFFNRLDSYNDWPNGIAGGYSLPAEITASFLDNKMIARLGRISHDWGLTPLGSSLAFNQMARPFLGIEAEFNPVSWFGVSSLTGFLEYHNVEDIKNSALEFQNMFSVTMLQFRYKNYLFFDFVDAVIYPKRFELGYISPLTNNFFYQNNVGDFDNMAITLNLKAQYPGLGNIWFSFFVDEMNLTSDLWTLDRQMVAVQGGTNIALPFLSFSSLKLSYTKINPYTYTHNRNFNPWYGDLRMETSYTNNGVGLGYYLPPNSDEFLAGFRTAPAKNLTAHLQYQLIRHGADFGDNAVDGGNLLSELDPYDRDGTPESKRFFLRDGAYQWSHIVKAGVEWNLSGLPLAVFAEAGAVISYFTDTVGHDANSGAAYDYSRVNTGKYTDSTGIIVEIGFRFFPR